MTGLEREARELARALRLSRVNESPWPRFAGNRIDIIPVGLRACLMSSRWPRASPSLVISAGTCGALSTSAAGTLVIPREILAWDRSSLTVDGDAHARAVAAALAAGYPATTEPLYTSRDVVDDPAGKTALRGETGAAAVDLESAAIVVAARDRGLPALAVRAVSDMAGQWLPRELTTIVDDAGRTRLRRAAAVVLRRPGLIGPTLVLRRGAALAVKSVAAVIARLAESW
jgi:uridine phosphorylase